MTSSSVSAAAVCGSPEDWRQIRAQRYKAEQQAAQAAPASKKLRSAVANRLSRLNSSTTWRHAAAALCLALLAMVAHRQVLNHFTLNQNDWQPDAWSRPAHEHRAYVMNKHDFVEVYSRKADPAWSPDFDMHKAGITRCATSQYAVTTYLCGTVVANRYHNPSRMLHSPAQLRSYVRHLDSLVQSPEGDTCSQWPQLVLRIHVDEATDVQVGHTFVIHFLPEGGVQVYQSFIRHFKLHTYLHSHGPLDAAGLATFIDNLEVIAAAEDTWGPAEDAAYENNFLVSLARSTGKTSIGRVRVQHPGLNLLVEAPAVSSVAQLVEAGRQSQPVSSGEAAESAVELSRIFVRMQLECLVVPWHDPAGRNLTDVVGRRIRLPPVAGDPAAADLLPTVVKNHSIAL